MKEERNMVKKDLERLQQSLQEGREVLRLTLGRFLSKDGSVTPADGEKKMTITRM